MQSDASILFRLVIVYFAVFPLLAMARLAGSGNKYLSSFGCVMVKVVYRFYFT